MPAAPTTVTALRSLLAARFPQRSRHASGFVASGVRALDAALDGGLPIGRITELVSMVPGSGGQTIIAQLLRTTRLARQRVALIDGADGFVASEVPQDWLRHLVWVRTRRAREALSAADILVRDGNYAAVVIDLRGLSEVTLGKTPAATWHRLRHATEESASAVLVQTTTPLVPAVPWRLVLRQPISLAMRRTPRAQLADSLAIEIARGHSEVEERSA